MAVYTEVSDEELDAFVARYDIGTVVACKGIAEGVENSNYLLQTDRDTFILTLYEKRVARADLPFFLGLMEHLAARGFICPTPLRARDGKALGDLCARPAAIISFLQGMWPRRISTKHCDDVGRAMARMHLAANGFTLRRKNALSVRDWRPLFEQSAPRADEVHASLRDTLAAELDYLEARWPTTLPEGVIHADLFPDNVFFLDGELSGVIDFYFACNDYLAYDIAVCLNAWCFEPDRSFNITKARQLLTGYQAERTISPDELEALPILARGSALRFLLTRLYDWLHTPDGALVKPKDPMEYLMKLQFHQKVTGPGAYGLGWAE